MGTILQEIFEKHVLSLAPDPRRLLGHEGYFRKHPDILNALIRDFQIAEVKCLLDKAQEMCTY